MEASFAHKSILTPHSSTNGSTPSRPSLANLQLSFSTNDIPTLKSSNIVVSPISPPKTQAQQQFHNHNASLGRIPAHAINNRLSREVSSGEVRREEPTNGQKQQPSELHASAAPFGPSSTIASPTDAMTSMMAGQQYPASPYYGGYGMHLMNMGMTSMQMGGSMGFSNQLPLYPQTQNQFTPYGSQYAVQGRFQDSQARVIQQRRMQNAEGLPHRVLACGNPANIPSQKLPALPTQRSRIIEETSMLSAKISTAVAISKSSWSSAIPRPSTLFSWKPICTSLS
jgi:hypothetical protein